MNWRFVSVNSGSVAHKYTGPATTIAKIERGGIVFQRARCDAEGRLTIAGAHAKLCKTCFVHYAKAATVAEFNEIYGTEPRRPAMFLFNSQGDAA